MAPFQDSPNFQPNRIRSSSHERGRALSHSDSSPTRIQRGPRQGVLGSCRAVAALIALALAIMAMVAACGSEAPQTSVPGDPADRSTPEPTAVKTEAEERTGPAATKVTQQATSSSGAASPTATSPKPVRPTSTRPIASAAPVERISTPVATLPATRPTPAHTAERAPTSTSAPPGQEATGPTPSPAVATPMPTPTRPLPGENTSVETDREALVAFYNATDGGFWAVGHNENWLTNQQLKFWHGVSTYHQGRVTGLVLPEAGISGEIPPELARLEFLWKLDLSFNDLSGEVPQEILDMPSLSELNIWSGNQLIHPDLEPLQALYDATQGDQWYKQYKWYSYHPIPWGDSFQRGTGRMIELDRKERVIAVDISRNNLKGPLPPSIVNLTQLNYLDLSGNHLTGDIQPEIGRLTGLRELGLGYDPAALVNVPRQLGMLDNLTRLVLEGIDGEIPPELGNLLKLNHLFLSGADLTIPPELGKLSELTHLEIEGITGEIPPELLGLENLEVLIVKGNGFTLSESIDFSRLVKLKRLELSPGGSPNGIPSSIGSLNALQFLMLTGNAFTGPIPPELGNLSRLRSLLIIDTQVNGEIPPELGRLKEVGFLSLNNNQLTGEIPRDLALMDRLATLHLSHNQLTGEIPSEFARLERLSGLKIDGNQLTGCIPAEVYEGLRKDDRGRPSSYNSDLGDLVKCR